MFTRITSGRTVATVRASRRCLATRRSSGQVCLYAPSVQGRVPDICIISASSARVLLLLRAHLPSVQLKSRIPHSAPPCMNNLICSKCSRRSSAEPFRRVCCLYNPLRFILSFFFLPCTSRRSRTGVVLSGAFNGKMFLLQIRFFNNGHALMCCG